MARFWPTAARLLRPGGTVALWGSDAASVHKSVPHADQLNAALLAIEDAELAPYLTPGNRITRGLYRDLGLPWTVTPPVPAFDETTWYRKVFGTEADPDDRPFFAEGQGSALVFDCESLFFLPYYVSR